jgi:GxxExxY protein
MVQTPGDLESLTETVIGCAIEVHRALGPGLLESVYRDCLLIELREAGLKVDHERRVAIAYKGRPIAGGLKLDRIVDERLILELKAVERLIPVFEAQTITYLKLTGCPAGLLINFNAETLKAGLRRLKHPDLYRHRL